MKRFFFSGLLIFLVTSLSAQYKTSPLKFSLLAGGHLSWMNSDLPANSTGSLRIQGSLEAHIDYFFEEHFAFSTGVAWSFGGGQVIYQESLPFSFISGPYQLGAGEQITYRLRCVEVPLGLKMASREIGYTTLFSDFGLNPMWTEKASGDTSDGVFRKSPVFKEVTRFNLGYHAELGFTYSFGNKTALVFSAYYKNTFLDVTTDYLDKPHDTNRMNQAGIRVGFAF